jgi:chromosome segregation ATPase
MARPTGSTAEVHKVRRDYRFAPETMQQIADGMAVFAGSLKETAFVERAITHYAEFLAGDPVSLAPMTQEMAWLQEHIRRLRHDQQGVQNVAQFAAEKATNQAQEIERLQVQLRALEQERSQAQEAIRDLETQLRQSRATVRALENDLREAKAAAQKPTEKKLDLSKAYQIKIRHEPRQECPPLPEGFAYQENEMPKNAREKNWRVHDDPVHTVLTQQWPISRVRKEVERLKQVPGITRIWIAKNGEAVTIVSGIPSDSWSKEGGKWIKE